jgi:hypothetical protein
MTTKRVRETQTERDNKGTALTELAQKQTMGLKSSLDQRNDTNAIQHDCNIRELAPMELSDEAQLNIVCNRYVGNTVAAWSQNQNQSMPQLLEPPYEGSKALLRTGKLWITSDDSKRLHFARRAPIIRQYCMKWHKWNLETMGSIDWDENWIPPEESGLSPSSQEWQDRERISA